ncbi:MAG: S8 family peptidase [Pseudomonadota bacterium]
MTLFLPISRGFAAVAMALLGAMSAGASAQTPNDPYYSSSGTWGQSYGDQWGLQAINLETQPHGVDSIIVAVIDTGIDYFHPDLDRKTIWRNNKETLNGRDDDGNGYIDDIIGWNFIEDDGDPWDHAGHGTHVAGVIAAATNNAEGVAGVNPDALIMPLKALNFVGRGSSAAIAKAIYYAADMGANIINLSLGSENLSRIEAMAIEYATSKDVLVIVAAGNDAVDAQTFGPAGDENVISVGAMGPDRKRAAFSNFGKVDIAAPGVEILSLRARRTDFIAVSGQPDYTRSSGFVGEQAKYYRASGTSFAAPFVSGVASLVWSKDLSLSAESVKRIILQSATDIETPGWDRLSGYGALDAGQALIADPEYFIEARIAEVIPVQTNNGPALQVSGVVDANQFDTAYFELGMGGDPDSWKRLDAEPPQSTVAATLGALGAQDFAGAKVWTLRLVVKHKNGNTREARYTINIG